MPGNGSPDRAGDAAEASESQIRWDSEILALNCPRDKPRRRQRKFAEPHRRAARILGFALTLGAADVEAWAGVSLVLRARLARAERVALAWAALRAIDCAERAAVLDALEVYDDA